jgi:hypothetical protein
MSFPRVNVMVIAALSTLACTSATDRALGVESNALRADTVNVSYGDLPPRVAALDAMAARRSPIVLRMERFSVEGTKIIFYLDAQPGRATVTIDERLDGGGIRTYTLSTLTLVRYEPSVWNNNVEVRKERFVPVEASTTSAGTYLLVESACLTGPCFVAF